MKIYSADNGATKDFSGVQNRLMTFETEIAKGARFMSLPPYLAEYAGYIGLAFAGAFLRANKWLDEDTKRILWSRVLFEVPIAIAVGAVAIGIGDYEHVSKPIVGGICALLGLLGPAFFTGVGDTILTVIKGRFEK